MEKEVSCLIVDDEPIARNILKSYVAQFPSLNLAGECKKVSEAYKALCEAKVDVLFLDIQMPELTGIAFLKSLRKTPAVVFTTAYPKYAVEGFDLNAVDYLLKPITFNRFCQALEKVQQRLGVSDLTDPPVRHVFIKQNGKLVRVDFDEIAFIHAERDFCSVILTNGTRLLAGMHLKLFTDCLPSRKFVRVHRSFIINTEKISFIQGNLVKVGEKEIPIGKSYKNRFFNLLGLELKS